MSNEEVVFRVERVGKKYKATVLIGPSHAIFCGEGDTMNEAIGACFVSNRELLGFAFVLLQKGKEPLYSTGCKKVTTNKMIRLINKEKK